MGPRIIAAGLLALVAILFSTPVTGQDPFNRSSGFDNSWNNQNTFHRPYNENLYGPGIHSDATGRPFQWRTQQGEISHFGTVKPDGYGHGVGMDTFGRPVKTSPYPRRFGDE
jgi:hypothetical protein